MALHSAVPSDLFPLVFSFLRENKLLSVAREFTKATGVKDQDPNAASLLDIFNNWLNSSGAKKRKLRSKEPSVTKKVKKDSSSSYESSSEDGGPLVKQPAFLLSGAKKTALGKPEVSSTKAGSCSIDDIDSEKDKKRKPPRKSVSVELKPTVAKHLPQKKPKRSNLVSESNSSSPSEVQKNPCHPPISKSTSKPVGGKTPTTTQKASNVKAAESSSSSNSSDDEGSTPEKKRPAKKMQPLHSAVVKPAVCTPKISCNKGLLTEMKESSNSHDSSDSLEDEKATTKSKPISDSSSEECEIKSKFSSKSLQAKAMVKPVPRKPTRPKNVSSSSDEGTDSHSSDDKTPNNTRTKASTSESLVTKAKSSLASTKRVKRSMDSNSSLSKFDVGKKVTSEKPTPKVPLPFREKVFMSEKNIFAASKDSSSDSDTSSTDKDDTCNPAVKHKVMAHGKYRASIAGKSPAVPTKYFLLKNGHAGSSSTSDSSGEDEQKFKKAVPTEQVKLNSAKKAKSRSSDSSSDSEAEREKKSVLFTSSQRTAAVSSTQKKATKIDNHNNTSRSEEEKSVDEKESVSAHRTATLETNVPEKNEESSEDNSSSEEQVKVLSTGKSLKQKTEVSSGIQNGKERTSASKALPQTPNTFLKVKAKKSQSAEPFRRVRDEEIEVDCRVGNNSFDAKRGAKGDWGEKANNVLKFTKGKSFRHEKTKKKRGNYCGGEISTSIKSIKFDSE